MSQIAFVCWQVLADIRLITSSVFASQQSLRFPRSDDDDASVSTACMPLHVVSQSCTKAKQECCLCPIFALCRIHVSISCLQEDKFQRNLM